MQLIERYLHEIGRHLPPKKRADILAELRSQILDTLEDRVDGEASEEEIATVLKEMGVPREVAAAYHPKAQYLIGPALFPLFRMVVGIVFIVLVSVQVGVSALSMLLNNQPLTLLDNFWGIIGGLPTALGFIVIVFYFLQRFEVQVDLDEEEEFDPRNLPHIQNSEPIKRGEQIFSIVMGLIIFSVLALFAYNGGFSNPDSLFANPVLLQYLPWVGLSIMAGIIIDLVLLWRDGWQTATRVAKMAANIFSLMVLGLLVQGHNAWLAEAGIGPLAGFLRTPELMVQLDQVAGMVMFRLAFTIAFIVTAIELAIQLFRLVRGFFQTDVGQEVPLVNA